MNEQNRCDNICAIRYSINLRISVKIGEFCTFLLLNLLYLFFADLLAVSTVCSNVWLS